MKPLTLEAVEFYAGMTADRHRAIIYDHSPHKLIYIRARTQGRDGRARALRWVLELWQEGKISMPSER